MVKWSGQFRRKANAPEKRGERHEPGGSLRWKMLALMLAGTVVIYVDRNMLGALAPILKKELEFHDRAIFLHRLGVPDRLFLLPAGRGLSDRSGWPAARLCGSGRRLGPARRRCTGFPPAGCRWRAFARCWASAKPSRFRPARRYRPSGSRRKERSIATGWFNSGSSIGATITPPLAIWLATAYGWQLAFLMTGVLGIIVCDRLVLALPRSRRRIPGLSPAERAYIESGRAPEPETKPSCPRCSSSQDFSASSSPASSPSPRGRRSHSGSRSTW